MDDTPLFEQVLAWANERARREFFSRPEVAARHAKAEELMAKFNDPNDPYDAHHGTDRSEESLAWLKENDTVTYERVMGKIERGE